MLEAILKLEENTSVFYYLIHYRLLHYRPSPVKCFNTAEGSVVVFQCELGFALFPSHSVILSHSYEVKSECGLGIEAKLSSRWGTVIQLHEEMFTSQ